MCPVSLHVYVARLARAWIETREVGYLLLHVLVARLARAWIETFFIFFPFRPCGRPPRAGVD